MDTDNKMLVTENCLRRGGASSAELHCNSGLTHVLLVHTPTSGALVLSQAKTE